MMEAPPFSRWWEVEAVVHPIDVEYRRANNRYYLKHPRRGDTRLRQEGSIDCRERLAYSCNLQTN